VVLLVAFLIAVYVSLNAREDRLKKQIEESEQLIIYVNGETGRDSNPGTEGRPVKTILGAANRARELANGPEVIFSNGSYTWPDANEIEDSTLKDAGLFDKCTVIGNKHIVYPGFIWDSISSVFPVSNYTLNSPNNTFIEGELVGKFVEFLRVDGTPTTQNDYRLILANDEGSITILGPEVSSVAETLNVFDINTTFVMDSSQADFYFLGGETFSLFKYITFSLEGGSATPGPSHNTFSLIASKVLGYTVEPWLLVGNNGGTANYQIVLFEDVNSLQSEPASISTSLIGSWIRNTNSSVFGGTSGSSQCSIFTMSYSKWDTQQSLVLIGADITLSNSFVYSSVGSVVQVFATAGGIFHCELGVRSFGLDIFSSNMQVANCFVHSPTPSDSDRLITVREGATVVFSNIIALGFDVNGASLGKFFFFFSRAIVTFNGPTITAYGKAMRLLNVDDSYVMMRDFDFSIDDSLSENATLASNIVRVVKSTVQATVCNWVIDGITAPIGLSSGTVVNTESGTIEITNAPLYAVNVEYGSTLQLHNNMEVTLEGTTTNSLIISQISTLIARGTSTFIAEAGTCVTITELSQATFTGTSDTNMLCGVEEFSILEKSQILVAATDSVILDGSSVNQTSLGSRINATTVFLGTADTSYVDGLEGPGIQQCSLRVE